MKRTAPRAAHQPAPVVTARDGRLRLRISNLTHLIYPTNEAALYPALAMQPATTNMNEVRKSNAKKMTELNYFSKMKYFSRSEYYVGRLS